MRHSSSLETRELGDTPKITQLLSDYHTTTACNDEGTTFDSFASSNITCKRSGGLACNRDNNNTQTVKTQSSCSSSLRVPVLALTASASPIRVPGCGELQLREGMEEVMGPLSKISTTLVRQDSGPIRLRRRTMLLIIQEHHLFSVDKLLQQ